MYDPNDTCTITYEGESFSCRFITGRQVKEIKRLVESSAAGDIEQAGDTVNRALLIAIADRTADDLDDMTYAQRVRLAWNLPAMIADAEFARLKKASASPSESATDNSASTAAPASAPTK